MELDCESSTSACGADGSNADPTYSPPPPKCTPSDTDQEQNTDHDQDSKKDDAVAHVTNPKPQTPHLLMELDCESSTSACGADDSDADPTYSPPPPKYPPSDTDQEQNTDHDQDSKKDDAVAPVTNPKPQTPHLLMELDCESSTSACGADDSDADPTYSPPPPKYPPSDTDQEQNTDHDQDSKKDDAVAHVTRRLRTPAWRAKQQKLKRCCRGLCPLNCRMGCRTKFSIERLHDIWEHFYLMPFDARRQWVFSFVTRKTRVNKRPHYIYHLPDVQNNRVPVCAKLFNRTIGYSDQSSLVPHMMLNTEVGALCPPNDRRGRSANPNAVNKEIVKAHILSIPGGISHYRRAHAPNVRYVAPELTFMAMYNMYRESAQFNQPKAACCYAIYLQVCHQLHISTAKLGHEECEQCELLKGNEHALQKHKRRARRTRRQYQRDTEAQSDEEPVYTLDLQKIVMLPRLEQFKQVILTTRLVAFHHTLAPAGGTTNGRPTISAVWHEGIAGRLGKEIASVVIMMIKESCLREKVKMTIWLDNCASQNKNYSLFTALWSLVNSDLVDLNTLTLKYFEAGHTFMAADNVHAATEREIKVAKNVIDIQHFADCVQKASSNSKVLQPSWRDFINLRPHSSARRLSRELPKLRELCVIEFRRGSNVIHVKRKFGDVFSDFNYLKKSMKQRGAVDLNSVPTIREGNRGIPQAKKEAILNAIVPIIRAVDDGRHERRAKFFENLDMSEDTADLAVKHDEDDDAYEVFLKYEETDTGGSER